MRPLTDPRILAIQGHSVARRPIDSTRHGLVDGMRLHSVSPSPYGMSEHLLLPQSPGYSQRSSGAFPREHGNNTRPSSLGNLLNNENHQTTSLTSKNYYDADSVGRYDERSGGGQWMGGAGAGHHGGRDQYRAEEGGSEQSWDEHGERVEGRERAF